MNIDRTRFVALLAAIGSVGVAVDACSSSSAPSGAAADAAAEARIYPDELCCMNHNLGFSAPMSACQPRTSTTVGSWTCYAKDCVTTDCNTPPPGTTPSGCEADCKLDSV